MRSLQYLILAQYRDFISAHTTVSSIAKMSHRPHFARCANRVRLSIPRLVHCVCVLEVDGPCHLGGCVLGWNALAKHYNVE